MYVFRKIDFYHFRQESTHGFCFTLYVYNNIVVRRINLPFEKRVMLPVRTNVSTTVFSERVLLPHLRSLPIHLHPPRRSADTACCTQNVHAKRIEINCIRESGREYENSSNEIGIDSKIYISYRFYTSLELLSSRMFDRIRGRNLIRAHEKLRPPSSTFQICFHTPKYVLRQFY